MKIAGVYSFKCGEEIIGSQFKNELREIKEIIRTVDSQICKTKTSYEKTMPGKILYSPRELNKAFKSRFEALGWQNHKILCDYSQKYYTANYSSNLSQGAFREIDFVKNCLGVEVQFGKYAFMVYNVCAKMTIFHKMGIINAKM